VFPVPKSLERLADQIDGWLELRVPERALALVEPLLREPAARAAGLELRIRAHCRLGNYADALADLGELRQLEPTHDWIDLTEAWCRRRTGDLRGAIRCARQLVERNHRAELGHFNLACYLALAGDTDAAIETLSIACGLDARCRDYARDEPDFDALRKDPRFRQLLRTFRGTGEGEPDTEHDDENGDDSDDV
jgi:tetratricopeptide (TPR) repeat protein